MGKEKGRVLPVKNPIWIGLFLMGHVYHWIGPVN